MLRRTLWRIQLNFEFITEILEFIKEIIDRIKLFEGAAILVFITGLWRFVFKSAFEIWWKNKLEQQKQEIENALSIQKDLALKKAEFEKVKLERVLPLLEEINSSIIEHNLMFNNYTHAIANKISYSEELEQIRLEQDEKMVSSLSKISIYIPSEFRVLLYQLRKVMSCSWQDATLVNRVLRNYGSSSEIAFAAQNLYSELVDCYYSMCSEYISSTSRPTTFSEILESHHLDQAATTNRPDPANQLAWKFILLPEYYDSGEKVAAQIQYGKFHASNNQLPRPEDGTASRAKHDKFG